MNDLSPEEELTQLKRELSKLKLEANLRKSLSTQLEAQKKIADQAKEEALKKSEELEGISGKLAKYLSPQIHEQIFSGKQSSSIFSSISTAISTQSLASSSGPFVVGSPKKIIIESPINLSIVPPYLRAIIDISFR